ncbi:MAG: EAL domain-containing protein [Pseudomonadales bacterium]
MNSAHRVEKARRDYNKWVAAESLEDYALRYTPSSFRKWSGFILSNTALGSISFLALEAIGATIAINYGFNTAFLAILFSSVIIFLTGIPIAYYAARYNIDMDLLTRSAGFGYVGSTITSLIYASFTFIFFALEAAIMAQALKLYFGLPLEIGYLLCSVVIIPLVFFGISLINRLQLWTQPIWLILMVLPYVFVLMKEPEALTHFMEFTGKVSDTNQFNLYYFGFAIGISLSLIAQIGEQVDYLRFMPDKTDSNKYGWWFSVILAGPGWIILGFMKQIGGIFLASLVVLSGLTIAQAKEPIQMYSIAYQYVFDNPATVLLISTFFVVLSQIKINVTNAYAGSLAWSNFFSRITHSHPGRVVWLVFNIAIALLLMEMGVFDVLEKVLGLYSNVAIAWIGAVVADLVINKPLKLSPPIIEFKRAYLHDINPVGTMSMLIASIVSIAAFTGALGDYMQAYSSLIALLLAFFLAPLFAFLTQGKYYIARENKYIHTPNQLGNCSICQQQYEKADIVYCPMYESDICSLCCSLDARCHDRCKSDKEFHFREYIADSINVVLGRRLSPATIKRLVNFISLSLGLITLTGITLWVLFTAHVETTAEDFLPYVESSYTRIFYLLVVVIAILSWWILLLQESRALAETELTEQNVELENEVSVRKIAEQNAYRLANYDVLTGLPNRNLLNTRIEHAVAACQRNNKKLALMFLDLDRFKTINDSLGHHCGDQLLELIAKRLNNFVRGTDTISRQGGDEFVILLEEVGNENDVIHLAEKIISTMSRPYRIETHDLIVTFSIGISLYPENGNDVATLLKNADQAMYKAKETGGNNYQFFNSNTNENIFGNMVLENELYKAIDEQQLFLQYQPQYDTNNQKIIGLEALIRWQHPEKGLISPNQFIPLAEQTSLILKISDWVLSNVCRQGMAWQHQGYQLVPIAVNVAQIQFQQPDFIHNLVILLNDTGYPAEMLELELTERIVMVNASDAITRLKALKELGVKLSIDDFGTGYSSMSYLKHFPIDRLKIDASFIRDVATDADDAAITSSIIKLADSLHLEVIAEGVENHEQLGFLMNHQCNLVQGFLFYEPMDAETIHTVLDISNSEESINVMKDPQPLS